MQVSWEQSESFLTRARNAVHATQEEWAAYMGCSVPTVVRLERNPGVLSLERLARWNAGTNDEGKAHIRRYLAEQFDI